MSARYVLLGIFSMTIITFASRALPFYFIEFFQEQKIIKFIAKALPFPIMVILVFFSISNISIVEYPYGITEVASIGAIILVHVIKRNLLLSVTTGVFAYGCLLYFIT